MVTTTDRTADAELVTRAAAGDRAAFSTLFRRHVDTVHDHVARWSRDHALASDATQEAFVALLDNLDSIRDGQAVLAWLLRTARNRAIDQLRRLDRERLSTPLDDSSAVSVFAAVDPDRASSPARVAEANEAAAWLWEVASGLDERTFTVMDLTVRHGLNGPELAAVLETTPGNANVLVHRMRERLRTLCGGHAFLRADGDCPAVTAIEASLPDPLDLAGARRLDEHAQECQRCEPRRRRAVAPLRAYAALAHVAAPASVHAVVETAADTHFGTPPPPAPRTRRRAARASVVLAAVVATLSLAAPTSERPPVLTAVEADIIAAPVARTASATPPVDPPPSTGAPTAPPSDRPSPTDPPPPEDPPPSRTPTPPPVVVTVARPVTGTTIAATAAAPTPVPVAATVSGADGAVVTWSSDRQPGTLLTGGDGIVVLSSPPPCTIVAHVLTVTAVATDGRSATDDTVVELASACPDLDVRILTPADGGAALAGDLRNDGRRQAIVDALAEGDGDDGAWRWTWTSDREAGVLLDASSGQLRLTTVGCTRTTIHTVTATAEDVATGATGVARVQVAVRPACPG